MPDDPTCRRPIVLLAVAVAGVALTMPAVGWRVFLLKTIACAAAGAVAATVFGE